MKFHHTLICVSLAMILLVAGCAGPKQPVMPTQTATWIRQDYGTPYAIPFFYYKLVLFYPSRGILAYFSGESDVPSVEQAKICPLKVYENSPLPPEKKLSLWAPNSIREFSETGYAENWFPNSSIYYYQISEVSDLDEEAFYEIFSDRANQDECFAIDIFKYLHFVDIMTSTP